MEYLATMESETDDSIILPGSSRRQGPRRTVQRMQSVEKLANASCLLKDTQTSTNNEEDKHDSFSRCGRCKICSSTKNTSTFISTITGRKYDIKHSLNCKSKFVIYLISCTRCGVQYVGKTVQEMRKRTGQHIGKCDTLKTHLARHFRRDEHSISIIAIDKLNLENFDSQADLEKSLIELELYWMKELRTIYPYGLNERVRGVGDISKKLIGVNVESLSQKHKRRRRSHGHRKTVDLIRI